MMRSVGDSNSRAVVMWWVNFLSISCARDAQVTGVIKSIDDKGATVALAPGIKCAHHIKPLVLMLCPGCLPSMLIYQAPTL